MNGKGTLEISSKIERINVYKEVEQKWDNLGLSFAFKIKDKTGELNIFAKDIDIDIDEIKKKKNELEMASENFLLCLKFLSSELNLVQTNKCLKFYIDSDFHYGISCDSDIERTVKILKREQVENSFSSSLLCLLIKGELNVPQVDLPAFSSFDIAFNDNLKRNFFTFIQTAALRELSKNYHDDMLKRWFLILDEIEIDRGNADFAKIMNVRNFVSHHFCDKKDVVKLIRKELPKAICIEKEKDVARFDRQNAEHVDFVRKYERLAEKRVRDILEQKLDTHCS
jgi:hypothetical protein